MAFTQHQVAAVWSSLLWLGACSSSAPPRHLDGAQAGNAPSGAAAGTSAVPNGGGSGASSPGAGGGGGAAGATGSAGAVGGARGEPGGAGGGLGSLAGAGGQVAGTSGEPGVSGAGTSAQAGDTSQGGLGGGPFVLSWQDDFDVLDASAWQLQTFTFDGNDAQFSTSNAAVANGVLTISLTAAPSGATKPYLGVEMRSAKTLTYGKVSARMRFATGSGVVSGLVLFYTPYPNCDWNEIDIEHLGKSSNTSQLNAQVFLGTPDPNCTASVTPTQDPQIVDLGFDAENDFHLYDIEWTPSGVNYYADGVLLRTWTANIDRLKLPETILLTIWASTSADWAGPLTSTSAPASADIDWIKVYDYDPALAGGAAAE
ncbi:MAG TPA: glycoside hydrolase family 16 protein [Polyangiaceae bacterium]|nr:glycoside hydrolase family 16 protein [Polyangiaceae bacterium]